MLKKSLVIVVAVFMFLGVASVVSACTNGAWNKPVLGECTLTTEPQECGSTVGTQTVDKTCVESRGADECSLGTKVPTTYLYTDKVRGKCPESYNENHGPGKDCRKVDVEEHYINPQTSSSTQSCTLETPDYRACAPEGQCSDACGQEATTVPDGKGGQTSCPATSSCTVPTHRWCTAQDDGSYVAQALPDSEKNPEGYPWTTENPTCMDLCSKVEGLQTTDELCQPEPPKTCEEGQTGEYPNCETPRHRSSGSRLFFVPAAPQPQIGEGASISCGYYLNSYIQKGAKNDVTEVVKLQSFLNEYLGLNLVTDGNYGKKSFEAVKVFQVKHANEVLTPWVGAGALKSTENGTGYVYKTTQRWINMIKCPELNIPMPTLD